MKKHFLIKTACALIILLLCSNGFSQSLQESQSSQIELPDLTTVVSSDGGDEETAPAPEFEDVLDYNFSSGDLVPVLPAVSVNADGEVAAAAASSDEKDIYASGQMGGGYPASFSGNFEVSRIIGADPFSISFDHYSASGFAGHNLADGYSTKNTAIELQKEFIRSNLDFKLSGKYEDAGNGFQTKVEGVAANNQDAVSGQAALAWNFAQDFKLDFIIDSEFYYRFADITKNTTEDFNVPKWIINTSRVTVDPELKLSWEHNGFNVGFAAIYNMEAWDKVINRGQTGINFAWKNDKLKVYADAGVVFGNNIGDNKVIPPFTVGLDAVLPVYFSDRKLNLSLTGGLNSKRYTTSELERLYNFSGLKEFSTESSNWFSQLKILVPLKASFTGNVAAGYSNTAFGNGMWTPDYTPQSLTSGLYGFSPKNNLEFYTDFSFTWKYKLFAATAAYHANWIDVPVLQNKHTFSVSFALQSQKGLWGASLDTSYLLDAKDNKPLINLEGYIQASSAVRIVLSVNDMIKLLGAEERLFAGQYAACTGNAMLLVQFLF